MADSILVTYATDLNKLPLAVFGLGPFNDVEKEWNDVRAQLDKALAKEPSVKPVAVEVFGGVFNPSSLRFPYNLIPALKKMPPSDIRDWAAIRGWASALVTKLKSES